MEQAVNRVTKYANNQSNTNVNILDIGCGKGTD